MKRLVVLLSLICIMTFVCKAQDALENQPHYEVQKKEGVEMEKTEAKKKSVYCQAGKEDPYWEVLIGLERKGGGSRNGILRLPDTKAIAVIFSVIEGKKESGETFIGKALTGEDIKVIYSKQKNGEYLVKLYWKDKEYQGKGSYE